MNQICLIIAAVCFTIGAFNKLAAAISPVVTWQNAGLAFIALALILG